MLGDHRLKFFRACHHDSASAMRWTALSVTTFQWARDGIPRDAGGEVSDASSWYGGTLLRGEIIE